MAKQKFFNFLNLIPEKCRLTHSHDLSQRSKVGEVVLDVLQVDLSSSEWATALLPAGVLVTDLLGEVLRVADLILAVKN